MKTNLFKGVGLCLVMAVAVVRVLAHPPPPPKASVEAAQYGTNNSAYMTPYLVAISLVQGGAVATQVVNNVTFQSNVTFLNQVNLSGKATFTSNAFFFQLSFATNHAAVEVLNLNCTDQAFTTNNNVAYTGFNIPEEYGNTNSAWCSVLVTNTSGSLKTITFAGCIGDTTGYVTNQSAFTVKKYPGMGTNVVFRPLN